jgi:hypothetical protein
MASRYKRGRLLVDPGFQLRLLARLGWYFFVWSVLLVHVSFAIDFIFIRMTSIALNHGANKPLGEVYLQFLQQLSPLLLTWVVIMPLLLRDLLRFSNRVAGPLYRCRKVMQEMAAGKVVREFEPRKRDLMKDFFADFNTLIREWNSRVSAGANGHVEIRQKAKPAEEAGFAEPAEVAV